MAKNVIENDNSPKDPEKLIYSRLKPLTASEVGQIALELQSLVGAQLQDCIQTAAEFGLGFYCAGRAGQGGDMLWLWFDLHPLRPLVVRIPGKAPNRKKIARPLTLFLRSRFFGRRLESVRADSERGRILIFAFHRGKDEESAETCEIEVRLFPHGQNIIARDGEKSIAENKPKDVQAVPSHAHQSGDGPRHWEIIEAEWRALQSGNVKSSGASSAASVEAAKLERDFKRALEKKQIAVDRMREELEQKISRLPFEIGEWLKVHGTLDVPPEWKSAIHAEKSLSWNIEELFRKAKENTRKAEGTRARIAAVEQELNALRAKGPGGFAKAREKLQKTDANSLLVHAEARGRRFKLGDDLEVYVGKSAADNMALLRRAQPFDYWLHLREQPGSHAIMRRTRNRIVSDQEFVDAGRWTVEQSIGKRASELKGERFDLLIVECRFVRPIKGDKLGRVNYTNDRVLTLRF